MMNVILKEYHRFQNTVLLNETDIVLVNGNGIFSAIN